MSLEPIHPSAVPVPLWRQLLATAKVVLAVQKGQSGTAALEQVPSALRPGVQALAFQVWRNLGRAQALRRCLAQRSPAPPVDALLCVALALVWDEQGASYDVHTLVNQAVEAAKNDPTTRAQSAFVNACLRRYLRERDALLAQTDEDPVARWNHPAWWVARLQKDHPTHWQGILQANNQPAPLTLRVNRRKISVADYKQLLDAANLPAVAAGPSGWTLAQAVPVQRLPGFADGLVSVQDGAAQMAADLLLHGATLPSGSRILDACAAPGGKTGHLLEQCDAEVWAIDQDARRTARIQDNLQRLGLQARLLTADAARPEAWWDGRPFDAVLLDAPCTASGIVRRHPDVRWLRRESDVAQLAAQQRRLLAALWPLVAEGGRLLYCTCSVFAQEGRAQVQAFLVHNTDAVLLPSPGHLWPQNPTNPVDLPENDSGDHDGFFYALFQKQSRPHTMG